MILRSLSLVCIILLCVVTHVAAQSRVLQVELESIRYEDGMVSMSVVIPKYKKRLKEAEAASRIRTEIVSKIIDDGIEKTPYNRRFEIDKSVKLDILVKLVGSDIQLYDLIIGKSSVYANCTFDIKHIERKLTDNGYLKKFGI